MKNSYITLSIYEERNYRLFLEVIKREIDKAGYKNLNATQAFMLMNIGDNRITIGEIVSRGYYVGTNATYNIKKLISEGYLHSAPSDYDKRSINLELTDKGLELINKLNTALDRYLKTFESKTKEKVTIAKAIDFLRAMETFWNDVLLLRS